MNTGMRKMKMRMKMKMRNNSLKYCIYGLLCAFLALISGYIVSVNAAVADNPEIANKALGASIQKCYPSAFKNPITSANFTGSAKGIATFMSATKSGIAAGAPNTYWDSNPTDCNDFMKKLLEEKGLAIPTDGSNVQEFLGKLGYAPTGSVKKTSCFYYIFHYHYVKMQLLKLIRIYVQHTFVQTVS